MVEAYTWTGFQHAPITMHNIGDTVLVDLKTYRNPTLTKRIREIKILDVRTNGNRFNRPVRNTRRRRKDPPSYITNIMQEDGSRFAENVSIPFHLLEEHPTMTDVDDASEVVMERRPFELEESTISGRDGCTHEQWGLVYGFPHIEGGQSIYHGLNSLAAWDLPKLQCLDCSWTFQASTDDERFNSYFDRLRTIRENYELLPIEEDFLRRDSIVL